MPASTPDHDPLHDLSAPLRAAVEAVRREPIPAAPLRRATDRARGVGRSGGSMRLPRLLLIAGAMAASFLFGVALRQATPPVAAFLTGEGPRPAAEVASLARGGVSPGGDLHPVSVGRLGSQWADWERMRLPGGVLASRRTAFPPQAPRISTGAAVADLSAQVVVDDRRARTTVFVTFHPAATRTDPWVEYPLPPGASVLSVGVSCGAESPLSRADPDANVLCGPLGSLPAGLAPGLRLTYEQPLSARDGHRLYSFPLPDCTLNRFSFTLIAEPTPGAVFQPREADRYEEGGRVAYRVRYGPVTPSGSISYVVPDRR